MAQTRLENTRVGLGEEESHAATPGCNDIAVLIWQALDEAFAAKSAQVIGHLAAGILRLAEMSSHQGPQTGIGKSHKQMTELAKSRKQSHDTGVAKAEPGSPLAVNSGRQDDLLQSRSADSTALAHALGVQETLVSLSANSAQFG